MHVCQNKLINCINIVNLNTKTISNAVREKTTTILKKISHNGDGHWGGQESNKLWF